MSSKLIALLNRKAGALLGGTEEEAAERVRAAFAAAGADAEIVSTQGHDTAEAVRRAAAGDARTIAVGGGDGTLRSAAAILAGTGKAMAVLPLGTFNHFAKELGVPLDLEAAAAAIVHGRPAPVDLAEINGRVFINHAAIGIYPHMVRRREELREREGWSKHVAMVRAALEALGDYPTFGLEVRVGTAARHHRSPFVFIGKNRYILESYGVATAAGRHELTLIVAHDAGRAALLRMGFKAFAGRLGRDSYDAIAFTPATIKGGRRRLLVELDGEIERLASPLSVRVRRDALQVVRPEFAAGAGVEAAGGSVMDWERIAGSWMEIKGRLRERFGALTEDEWNVIAGKREQLVGRLQQRYGISAEEAERQVAAFEAEERTRGEA